MTTTHTPTDELAKLERVANAVTAALKASAAEWERDQRSQRYQDACTRVQQARGDFADYATPERIARLCSTIALTAVARRSPELTADEIALLKACAQEYRTPALAGFRHRRNRTAAALTALADRLSSPTREPTPDHTTDNGGLHR